VVAKGKCWFDDYGRKRRTVFGVAPLRVAENRLMSAVVRETVRLGGCR